MANFSIDRLEVTVSGIDPGTAEAAARALPRLVAARLGGPAIEPAQDGAVVRVGRSATAGGLAGQIADRVVGEIRARAADQHGGT